MKKSYLLSLLTEKEEKIEDKRDGVGQLGKCVCGENKHIIQYNNNIIDRRRDCQSDRLIS